MQHVRSAAHLRHAQQQLDRALVDRQLTQAVLEADEVATAELREQQRAPLLRHVEAVEQRRVQRRVADPDAVARETGAIERAAEHRDGLGGPGRPAGADQLDPRLQELARLSALRADAAVAVREIGEAQRQLGRSL